MKILASDGAYERVEHGWPLAGTRSRSSVSSALNSIRMIGSRGVGRNQTYREIYLTNPWVWAAVNTIGRGMARLPVHTYVLDGDGERSRVRGDVPQTPGRPPRGVTLDRLLQRPNPTVSRFAHWVGTVADRLTYGNALWTLDRDAGTPVQAWRVPWREVTTHTGSTRPVTSYEVGGLFRGRHFSPDDVVHFGRHTDPEGVVGVSPLEACKHTLALHEGVVRHLIAYFENEARPSGHLKVGNVTRDRAKEIRQLLTEAYSSPENAGKILVTSGEWQQVTDTPEHSEVVELIKLSREEIAAAYAIPPPVLGILDRAIKSNVKELREHYIRDAIGPWAAEFESEIDAQLITASLSWRHHFVEFVLAAQLRPDLEARSQVYERMKRVLSIDEIRRLENETPLDIAGVSDVPWVDSGSMPLSAFGSGGGAPSAEQVAREVVRMLRNGHEPRDELEVSR